MPQNKSIRVSQALLSHGWESNVHFEIDSEGWIEKIQWDSQKPCDETVDLVVLPGMPNVHSHAFQRAFAGSTEYRMAAKDSFWTWREKMFEFVRTLHPDQVYEIAKRLYREMLLTGYTWVGEFHYLHGRGVEVEGWSELEMCQALLQAASDVGIGCCLIPTLYQRGGFDARPLSEGQARFYLPEDRYIDLLRRLVPFTRTANQQLAAGIHSLRAVDTDIGNRVLQELASFEVEMPIHMHVAEQVLEVTDCQQHHGRSPIDYLLDSYDVDSRWCLIHGTQGTVDELSRLAKTNAVVCLCPTTEGNLGDGIFLAKEFMDQDGRIALGSDSHCSIDVQEELRWLEYSQRYRLRERAVLCSGSASVGHHLYKHCAANGGRAIGVRTGVLDVGYRADFVLVDHDDALDQVSQSVQGDRLLDQYLFCNHPKSRGPRKVMVGGEWIPLEEDH